MQRQFFSGNTIEQAVMAAARHYKIEPEKLSYKQREKKHGFLNVRKRIVIEVDPSAPERVHEEVVVAEPEARPEPKAEIEAPRARRDIDDDESPADHHVDDDRRPDAISEQRSDRGEEDRNERPRGGRTGRGRGPDRAGRAAQGSRQERSPRQDREPASDERKDSRRDARPPVDRGGRNDRSGRNSRSEGQSDRDRRDTRGETDQGHREDNRRDKGRGKDARSNQGSRDQPRGRGGRSSGRRDSNRDKRKPVEINEFEWLGVDWDENEIKDEVERDLAAYEIALEHVLDVMDLDIEYSLEAGEVMELDFEGEDSEMLLEDDGRVLKAIEHILPRMVRSLVDKSVPCNTDCQGFRASHEKRLEEMALNAAESALESGRKKMLAPMSPADRRIVHLALVDRSDIETVSEGHGFMKRVKVIPLHDPDADHRSSDN